MLSAIRDIYTTLHLDFSSGSICGATPLKILLPEQCQNVLILLQSIANLPSNLHAETFKQNTSPDRCQPAVTTISAASKQPHATPHGPQQNIVLLLVKGLNPRVLKYQFLDH